VPIFLQAGLLGQASQRPLWCAFRTQVRHYGTSEMCQQRNSTPADDAFKKPDRDRRHDDVRSML